jgi:hypothetical protein
MIGNFALSVLWPLTIVVLFVRTSIPVALSVSVIGGYLLLPTVMGFNVPLLPRLDKDSIPAFVAILCLLFGLGRMPQDGPALPGLLPRSLVGMVLVPLLFVAAAMTALTNGDRLVYGPLIIPGLGPYDAFSAMQATAVTILPLLLARKYLHSAEQHRTLIIVFAVAGLLYSLPALYEVRMSPRLNATIYGFFPHSWQQHIRGDGFRPLVFLKHGLWLGIFFTCSLIALLGLYRLKAGAPDRGRIVLAILWMAGTLILAKTLSALIIAIAIMPVILFMPIRLQTLSAALIAMTVLLYPLLRQADVLPVQKVADTIRLYEPTRAASLQYRLNNEDILLELARERFLFGWGGWGRFRAYDEDTGRDASTADGRWVIVLGSGGMARYLGSFGLFALPVLLLFLRGRQRGVSQATAALGLMMAANLTDMLLNGTETPLTWLMAGALLGHVEQRAPAIVPRAAATSPPDSQIAPPDQHPGGQPVYTRQTVRHNRKALSDT